MNATGLSNLKLSSTMAAAWCALFSVAACGESDADDGPGTRAGGAGMSAAGGAGSGGAATSASGTNQGLAGVGNSSGLDVGGTSAGIGGTSSAGASGTGMSSGTNTGGGASAAGAAGMTSAAGAAGTVGSGFVHPGLLVNAADIGRMRAKVSSKSDPWTRDFNTLAGNNLSSATRTHNAPPEIIGRNSASKYATTRYGCEADAVNAFQNALVYAVTAKTEQADHAVTILNAYAAGVKHFDGVDPERDLEAAILGWLWVSTAELIRYADPKYTGWATVDIAKFGQWIRNVVYADTNYNANGVLITPIPNGAGARGAFALRTKMAIGIYLEDKTIYEQAVDYFFHGQGNGAPQYYIEPTTGQTWEAGRDQGHAQGGLSRLMETAHMAHNQGDETLYAWGDNALSRAIEYIAKYNLGNDVPYTPMQPFTTKDSGVNPSISSSGRGMFATIYELPYSYWHGVKGMAMPYTLQAIGAEGSETFSLQYDNPMFATLTYRQ